MARDYARRHGVIGPAEQGVAARIFDMNGDLVDEAVGAMKRLHEILAASAAELEKAAAHYRTTDLTEAAKLDAAYRKAAG
ncbi:hypothetical protein GCM10009544_64800 [Streptomyces stramineus]|uniref:ESX-1 secretion-associated protein n=1 Tax=Streptomyces stramineus TaxID=173861 RepID=A0ABN1BE99_9ACTN